MPVSDEKIGLEYKIKRFLGGSLLLADEAHFYWNGTFSQSEQRELGLKSATESLEGLVRGTPRPTLAAVEILNRYLFVDQHYYLPDDILYKCDRMSMAHSLEVRPPFLDHRLVDFAARLPAQLKIKGKTTKRVLRELVSKKLPAEIMNRPKEGLDIPAHEWLRGPLRPLVMETLGAESVKHVGLFSPSRHTINHWTGICRVKIEFGLSHLGLVDLTSLGQTLENRNLENERRLASHHSDLSITIAASARRLKLINQLIGTPPAKLGGNTSTYLASDKLKGRNVGSPGYDMAAEYVAEQFKKPV